ncbi:hypothetical protein [Streptomyces niveus]|uniref:Uncharacterized protein n=1 Tax=Streptomyces niveus TaxID=193462 RepID=A0ABZ2A203_STRNV|nr:hypothetical protein [Streptomyces niveus]
MAMNRKSKVLAGVSASIALAAAAGIAFAAAPGAPADTPHAQAAAWVNADGTVNHSRGIAQVTRPSTGRYCVTLSDVKNINAVIPVATLVHAANGSSITFTRTGMPLGLCDGMSDTILVNTHDKAGAFQNYSFDFVTP